MLTKSSRYYVAGVATLLLGIGSTVAATYGNSSNSELVSAVSIKKYTNGEDADTPPGPQVTPGSTVTWTYVVTNQLIYGTLFDIEVTDSEEGPIDCPSSSLSAQEFMVCEALGTAEEGQYSNVATVTAKYRAKGEKGGSVIIRVKDRDRSHYFACSTPPPSPSPSPSPSPEPGEQGCTPGYWKNHLTSWQGFVSGQTVLSVFASSSSFPAIAASTLLQALDFPGGPGAEGGARNLLRAAVAALLNSAHAGVDYPRTTAEVIADVNAALATGDRDTMLALAAELDADNNLGCPLN